MTHTFVNTIAASAVATAAAMASMPASAMDILARVISSTPVVQQVAVPRQVCSQEAVMTQADHQLYRPATELCTFRQV